MVVEVAPEEMVPEGQAAKEVRAPAEEAVGSMYQTRETLQTMEEQLGQRTSLAALKWMVTGILLGRMANTSPVVSDTSLDPGCAGRSKEQPLISEVRDIPNCHERRNVSYPWSTLSWCVVLILPV